MRAGVLVQKAYNPGGTTLRFDIARPDNFGAESLWDYEVFGRARFGRAVTASANLFYYQMHNAQRARDRYRTPGSSRFADRFNVARRTFCSYGNRVEPERLFSAHSAWTTPHRIENR